MILDRAKLHRVFRLVADLEVTMNDYCKDGRWIPVPWQNAVDAIEQTTQIKITVTRVDVVAEGTNGTVRRYSDNTADVVVQHGMSVDLDNFTIVKEATHPLIDEPEDMSPDGVATLRKLVTSSWFGNGDGKHDMDPILQSEHLATIAAAAIVVPRRLRGEYRDALAKGTTTLGKIALELNVPEHIVSLALADSFHAECEAALVDDQKDAA